VVYFDFKLKFDPNKFTNLNKVRMTFTDYSGLSTEEEAKCWEAFSAFDKNSSGTIDAYELRIVLDMLGCRSTDEDIYRMIGATQALDSGEITYSQFKLAIAE
jgi:Ca2+-binding EF-hand superfamily protein